MGDIVERLRAGEPCVICWGDKDGTCEVKDARSGCGCAEAADEITRLREELSIWKSVFPDIAPERVLPARSKLEAEVERLRAALESVMIGGNSLAQIIGADHPPHGTPYSEALAYYGSGVKYEAWCCWNTIMLARAARGDTHE